MSVSFPKSVQINDDTMREGLQIENPDIPIDDKLRLLDAIGEMGASEISIGSFVNPKWTPAMANVEELAKRFVPKPGVKYTAVVFNQKGFERADAFYPKLNVRDRRHITHVELCDTFARRNYNRSQREQIGAIEVTAQEAVDQGEEYGSVSIGNPFGSNFEGEFSLNQRLQILALMINTWHKVGVEVRSVSFLDAMGWNMPHTVRETLLAIQHRYPEIRYFNMHLHNTRGVGLASYYEALCHGVTNFDTSLGGMGGCPYCGNGRAAGHVPTEDFVHMCHQLGIETGYDLDKVIEAVNIAEEIVGHPLHGHVSRAGPMPARGELYPKDMPFVETLEEASHYRKGPSVYEGQHAPWQNKDALKRVSDG